MATSIVVEPLNNKNYKTWRSSMKSYLMSQDLWTVVEYNESENPTPEPEENREAYEIFKKKDAAALQAILISCSSQIRPKIRGKTSARDAWCALAVMNNHWLLISLSLRHEEHTDAAVLLKAINEDNVNYIKDLLDQNPGIIRAKLFQKGYTALHLAVTSNKLEVVKELVSRMFVDDMKVKDASGNTALGLAALNGGKMIKIVDCLIRKNHELLMVEDEMGIPLKAACIGGHKDMIYHMYFLTTPMLRATKTKFRLSEDDAAFLLGYFIAFRCLDIALDLLRRCGKFRYRKPIISAVSEFSFEPSAFRSGTNLGFCGRLIYNCIIVNLRTTSSDDDDYVTISTYGQDIMKNIKKEQSWGLGILKFLGIKRIYDLKMTHAYTHKFLRLLSNALYDAEIYSSRVGNKNALLYEAIFEAARLGIPETIVEIIQTNPHLLWLTDDNGRSMFHIAVVNRQEKVFNLIYGIVASKSQPILLLNDKDGKSMLHMVAESPPQRLKDQVQGAALLMQRECQWFQEVESIVPRSYGRATNDNKKTPYEVFDEKHNELVKQGEEWMKNIAQSSTVVGALIITITFAALFTVPGGNNQDTSIPFLEKQIFKLFIISDAISLFASSTSVLMFLSILTTSSVAKDFLTSLPTKLIIALFTFFISITTMMIAFCSSLFIVLKGLLSFVIPIIVLASIPVVVFVLSQFPLLVTVCHSTYVGIFDRKMKKWL